MEMLKRDEGSNRWDVARILGAIFTVGAMIPFAVWLYELLLHVAMHPGDAFNPALSPKDMWIVVLTGLAVGLGLMFGKGRELTNALIDRIRGP